MTPKKTNEVTMNSILRDFSVTENFQSGVWYPHRIYPELVLMRPKDSGSDPSYRLALLSDVSAIASPNMYDPYDIVSLMEGRYKPGSLEDLYERYLKILARPTEMK